MQPTPSETDVTAAIVRRSAAGSSTSSRRQTVHRQHRRLPLARHEGDLPLIRQLACFLFAVAGIEANGVTVVAQHDIKFAVCLAEVAGVRKGRPQSDRGKRHHLDY